MWQSLDFLKKWYQSTFSVNKTYCCFKIDINMEFFPTFYIYYFIELFPLTNLRCDSTPNGRVVKFPVLTGVDRIGAIDRADIIMAFGSEMEA